jgi:competence protein ComEC
LKSTILIAPHHGSRTSSSVKFIDAVQPKFVVFSAGYRNRFRFPSKKILRRYRRYIPSATLYNTAKTGEIDMKLDQQGVVLTQLYLEQYRRIWHS